MRRGVDVSLIRCPECGTRISDKARTCPICGFESSNTLFPISRQDYYHPIPTIESKGDRWEIVPISDEDNGILMNFFSKHENLKVVAPGIAETISSLFTKNNILVADIDKYTQSLIDSGVLKFVIDKKGNILPELAKVDTKKISELIRLKEISIYPELGSSVNNLSNQVAMAEILDELHFIEEKMANIQKELQEDRLAMADGAWDKMMQARYIEDYRLKTIAIQNAINSATDAKRVLMRNFAVSYKAAIKLKKPKDSESKAQDAAKDLVALTNCVHVECDGYIYLGEYSVSKECLREFLKFIKDNKLDNRNTLLKLNENLPLKDKMPTLSDDFTKVVARLNSFVDSTTDETILLEE